MAGPNGAGKSTLLRVLAGLMRPDRRRGARARAFARRRQRRDAPAQSGCCRTSRCSTTTSRCAENLTFAARLYGLERPGAAARRALEAAGLEARAGDLPRTAEPRPASAGRHRAGVAARPAGAAAGRAVHRARRAVGGSAARGPAARAATRAWGSWSSPTIWRRCGTWRHASRCWWTGAGCATRPAAGSLAAFLPRYREWIGA